MCSVRCRPSLHGRGCPIRRPADQLARQLPAAFRRLATSFIGSHRLGIHHTPLLAWPVLGPAVHEAHIEVPRTLARRHSPATNMLVTFFIFALQLSKVLRRSFRLSGLVAGPDAPWSARVEGQTKAARPQGRRISITRLRTSCLVPHLGHADSPASCRRSLVEPRGLEPLTSAVQRRRSPS